MNDEEKKMWDKLQEPYDPMAQYRKDMERWRNHIWSGLITTDELRAKMLDNHMKDKKDNGS